MTFRDKYPGRCPSCDEDIEIGDRLVPAADGTYVHEHCPDEEGIPLVPRETCPRCFTEKSVTGACLCDEEGGES